MQVAGPSNWPNFAISKEAPQGYLRKEALESSRIVIGLLVEIFSSPQTRKEQGTTGSRSVLLKALQASQQILFRSLRVSDMKLNDLTGSNSRTDHQGFFAGVKSD